jgi:predicted Zn-dependent peptidase
MLPNGITLLTTPMPHVRSVTAIVYLRIGARYERPEEAGVAHFIEHMLFKGTQRFPTARAISERIDDAGGYLNASTGKELTDYIVRIRSDELPRALDVLTEMLRQPLFEESEIAKERRVITEELRMYKDAPADWVEVLMNGILFPESPLGHEVVGTEASLQSLTREQILAFWQSGYVTRNLVVSLAGDVTPDAALAAVESRLGDMADQSGRLRVPVAPPLTGPYVTVEARPVEQLSLSLAVPALSYGDPDRDALALLNIILGSGDSSRLYQRVREDLGLAYDIDSSTSAFHETGAFDISVGCDPERAEAVITTVMEELRCLCDTAPSEEEMQRAKNIMHGSFVISLEDSASVAGWYGSQMAMQGMYRTDDAILASIDAVTPDDIQRIARRIFRTEALRLAAIGPGLEGDRFLPLLRI